MNFEYSMGAKWLELLKEIAPSVTRVAVLRDLAIASGTGQFGVVQAIAPSLRVEVNPIGMRDASEIERSVAVFAGSPNGGLIVTASGSANVHRDLIVTLAARHKLPTVYYERFFAGGGLISLTTSTSSAVRPATSIASSGARSRPTCRCRRLRRSARASA